jgi:hypothetical protein
VKPGLALVASLLFALAGCFVFDNPYDRLPSASFRIVVTSASYGATYEWNQAAGSNGAFKSSGSGTTYYFYRDPSDRKWYLSDGADAPSETMTMASSTAGTALPPPSGSGWTPPSVISSIDDSAGGIWGNGIPTYTVGNGCSLQVHYVKSDLTDTAGFQWQSAAGPAGAWADIVNANGDTFNTATTYPNMYIRVLVTPKDATGSVSGTPAASPPVFVNGA